MPLYVLIIAVFVILTFVIGVSFLYRGYAALPNAAKLAPVAEFEKMQEDLKLANGEKEKLRAQANVLAVQLEEMKGKLSWAQENVTALEEMLKTGSQEQSRLEQLGKDLEFLSQKADTQAREAIDVITRLSAENENLQRSSAQTRVDPNLVDENQKLKIQVEGYVNKAKELEAEIQSAREIGGKLAEADKAHAQLTQDNEALKKELVQFADKIKAAQLDAENLKTQQSQTVLELQNKVMELEAENRLLHQQPVLAAGSITEQELKQLRLQNEERIAQANMALAKINGDMELLNAQIAQKDVDIKKLSEELLMSRSAFDKSSADDAIREDLLKQLKELRIINEHLQDKEKILIYKLAQARAQAMSFEKICEEFKYQFQER